LLFDVSAPRTDPQQNLFLFCSVPEHSMILLIRNLACSPCGLNNLSNTKAYPLYYNSYCPLINQINCLQEPEIIQQNNTQYHTNLVIFCPFLHNSKKWSSFMDCLTSQFCNKQLITLNWECFVRFIIHKGSFLGRSACSYCKFELCAVNCYFNTQQFFPTALSVIYSNKLVSH